MLDKLGKTHLFDLAYFHWKIEPGLNWLKAKVRTIVLIGQPMSFHGLFMVFVGKVPQLVKDILPIQKFAKCGQN